MKNEKTIIVDYYGGAYGPTLRIDVPSREMLDWLKSLFADLAGGTHGRVDLLHPDRVRAVSGIAEILLLRDASVRPGQRTLRLTGPLEKIAIRWAGPPAYWSRCSALVDGLVASGRAGHQYLTDETVDDVLVELSFMEARG
jgi:hypothetical protein